MVYRLKEEGLGCSILHIFILMGILLFISGWSIFGMQEKPSFVSRFEVVEEKAWREGGTTRLVGEILDAQSDAEVQPLFLPARVTITASDGSHPDGSGRGVYQDGRFYCEGRFAVEVLPGETRVFISSGPDYIPLDFKVDLKAGRETRVRVFLKRWFSPRALGWCCGDNHLHIRHDPAGEIKIDEEYGALQAKAEGLDYITECDAGLRSEDLSRLSGRDFLYRQAPEIHTGCFTGHANTPGIRRFLNEKEMEEIHHSILPFQVLCRKVHELGGIVIYTHTLPVPRLHWMGATESLSDAVMGNCADAFDVGNRMEELVWFTILNLGNKVAVSGSTDAVLLRRDTPPPGARRVYCRADGFDYEDIVEGIRQGRTFVTNAGPIFPFLEINGHQAGDRVKLTSPLECKATLKVYHLYPITQAEIIRNGNPLSGLKEEIRSTSPDSPSVFDLEFREDEDAWYVARVEDEKGNWALTSPIYFERKKKTRPASLIALEIGNFTRLCELRRSFFAHIIVTVSQDELQKVVLLRDGKITKEFSSSDGDYMPSGKIPVTQLGGEYSEGWVWYPSPSEAVHFQADYPVDESGWYSVQVFTRSGRKIRSEEIYYDASEPNSQEVSLLCLNSEGVSLTLRGYGEEMSLKDIKVPFEGDHWWYPYNAFLEVEAIFKGQRYFITSGGKGKGKFRRGGMLSDCS